MKPVRSIRLISLGCPKNLIDAEVLLGKLTQAGYQIAPDNRPADIIIINTCCFIKEAQLESQEIIEQAIRFKQQDKYKKIIVAGCYPQHDPAILRKKYGTKIDALVSLFQRDRIVDICEHLFRLSFPPRIKVRGKLQWESREREDMPWIPASAGMTLQGLPTTCRTEPIRLRLTPFHYSYVRIAEGCSNACTYCILPHLHGRYRSKPLEIVLNEVKALVRSGVREINLVAQDTTAYGGDLYGKPWLSKLLERLSRINDLKWLRLLYTHPAHFTPDLIEIISRNDKIVKYLDLPIQHINDSILKRMGRGISARQIKELIDQLRTKIKGLFLRTTVIVGFPGEKEADFQQLLDFLHEIEFERLGAFQYSVEAGTPAARFKPQIPGKVKETRYNAVMSLQQQIAFKKNKELIGKKIEIIIDSLSSSGHPEDADPSRTVTGREGDRRVYIDSSPALSQKVRGQNDRKQRNNAKQIKIGFVGRTYGDAPEVDGNIYLKETGLTIGQIYNARVTGTQDYDLIGKIEHPIRFTAETPRKGDPYGGTLRPAKAKRRANGSNLTAYSSF